MEKVLTFIKSKEEPTPVSSPEVIVTSPSNFEEVRVIKRKGGKKGRKMAAQKLQTTISLDGKLIT
jgi:hypothetical protein